MQSKCNQQFKLVWQLNHNLESDFSTKKAPTCMVGAFFVFSKSISSDTHRFCKGLQQEH